MPVRWSAWLGGADPENSAGALAGIALVACWLDIGDMVRATEGERDDVIACPDVTVAAVWSRRDAAPQSTAERAMIESSKHGKPLRPCVAVTTGSPARGIRLGTETTARPTVAANAACGG